MADNYIELLERLLKILKEEDVFDQSGKNLVVRHVHPRILERNMSFSLEDKPASDEQIETTIRQIINYSVRTCSPYFRHQIYGGIDKYGLVGSWLAEIFNVSVNHFKIAPVFTLIEEELISMSLEITGFPQRPRGEGVMTPNRVMSNMYAMLLARHSLEYDIEKKGVRVLPRLACFTSEHGHNSIMHAADLLGIGTKNVYKIRTDKYGRMSLWHLKKTIMRAMKARKIPFFVNATAGTAALGAIDPLMEISKICWSKIMWFHVDACLGGTLLFSKQYRKRLRGIERANSAAWNPHEMFGAPLQCSVFLIRNMYPSWRKKYFDLLYETDIDGIGLIAGMYDMTQEFDENTICTRKTDAMKFWLMWKARGTCGLQRLVKRAFSIAEYFLKRIKETPGFVSVLPEYQCCNICFWYIPPSMRDQEATADWWMKLYEVTTVIKRCLTLEGILMVNTASLPWSKHSRFFRIVVHCQPPPKRSFVNYIISKIEGVGADM